jgi:hypothetical protein
VRRFAAGASAGLPAPWPDQVRAAALARVDRLPEDLAQAANAAHPGRRLAIGWWVARILWWLGVAAVIGAAAWLGWSTVYGPEAPRLAGQSLPLLVLVAGAVLAVLTLLIGRPLAALGRRRHRAKVQRRLQDAMRRMAREVVGPCRTVLRDYADARAALDQAS